MRGRSGRFGGLRAAALAGPLVAALLATACWDDAPCCQADSDCASAYACLGGVCRARCRWEGECPRGQHCDVDLGVCAGGPEPAHCGLLSAWDAGPADLGATDRGSEDANFDAAGRDRVQLDQGPTDRQYPDIAPQDWALPDLGGTDLEPLDKPPDEAGGDDLGDHDGGLCVDDIFEENDRRDQAVLLTDTPVDGVVCPGDSDFFAADRVNDSIAHARLECPEAPGIVFMILRLPGNARQARSCDPAIGFAEASLSVAPPGTAYVEVFTQLAEPAAYTLQLWLEGVTHPCGADPFEPNNSIAEAYALQSDTYAHGAICAGDLDTFAVTAYAGEIVRATQEVQQSCPGDLMTLYSTDGTSVLDTVTSAAGQRTVYAEAVLTGQHYVQLVSGCADSQIYLLSVSAGTCQDDSFEDNDTLETASLAPPGSFEGEICWRDDDFFRFSAGSTLPIRLDLRFRHSIGDLDLALFDPSGSRIGLSQGIDDYEIIEHLPSVSGEHVARVYGFSGAVGPYSLGICWDDHYEENDNPASARLITSGSHALMLCRYDEDYMVFSAEEGRTVTVEFLYQPPADGLVLQLLREADSVPVGTFTPTETGQVLVFDVAISGRYLLVVSSEGDLSLDYAFTLDVPGP